MSTVLNMTTAVSRQPLPPPPPPIFYCYCREISSVTAALRNVPFAAF